MAVNRGDEMAITQLTESLNIVQSLGDRPNALDGLSAAQLKAKFDEAPNLIKAYINTVLIAELAAVTDGDSGADNIGATTISNLDGATVQAVLESLRNKLKSIADGSSGADFIGATSISGLDGDTVQELLEALKTYIDSQDVVIGENYVSKAELTSTRKLDSSANFTGSWHGISNPALADPGIAGVVEQHTEQLADIAINIKHPPAPLVAAVGNGVTDDTAAIQAVITNIGSSDATIFLPSGTYKTTTNINFPANVSVLFSKGAKLSPANATILTFLGVIQAGNHEIFVDNGATIDLDNSPNEYNLGWFSSGSGYINQRWDFAKRGMATFRKKIVRFPKPYEGQAGVLKSGNRLYWQFNNEMLFTDDQNNCTIYLDGEFYAAGNCTNFINIEDATKPENIYFYGDLQVNIPATTIVTNGINVKSVARLTFFGNVVINGAKTTIKLGGTDQVAAVTDVRFIELQCSFFTDAAVYMYGKAAMTVQNIIIDNLSCTAAQTTGKNAAELRGLLRDIKLGNVYYATDVAKNGYTANDAENVVYIESNSEGDILHCEVSAIYQANANNGIKITSVASSSLKIRGVVVRRIHGKFNNAGADLDWCYGVHVSDVENTSNITLGTNALYTKISSGEATKTITDNGAQTTINGLGKQSRGAGVLPAANLDWPIGTLIRETSDGKVYLRYAKTGVAATDFVLLN